MDASSTGIAVDSPYRVTYAHRDDGPSIAVVDRRHGQTLFAWSGSTACLLMEAGATPLRPVPGAYFDTDKTTVRKLLLCGTAAEMRLNSCRDRVHALVDGAQEAPAAVPGAVDGSGRIVLDWLRRLQPVHCRAADLAMAMATEGINVSEGSLAPVLESLAAARRLRRIEVPGSGVFYDARTEPHAHVFVEDRDQLYDAAPSELDAQRLLARSRLLRLIPPDDPGA